MEMSGELWVALEVVYSLSLFLHLTSLMEDHLHARHSVGSEDIPEQTDQVLAVRELTSNRETQTPRAIPLRWSCLATLMGH